MKMKSYVFLAYAFGILLVCLGCSSGYEKIDGQWLYVTYDEGAGRRARKLDVDSITFQVIDRDYAKNDSSVFYKGRVILNARSESFRVLKNGYSSDENSVFLFNYQVINAVPEGFEVLGGLFSRDVNGVFNGTLPLTVSDISSFEVVKENSRIQFVSTKEFVKRFPSYSTVISERYDVVVFDNSVGRSKTTVFEGPHQKE